MREHQGAAIGVAVFVTGFLTVLAALLVVFGWIGLSIYAIVKAVGSAPDSANATVVVLILAGLVAAFTVLLAVTTALVGRSMTPKRRSKRDAEQLAVDLPG